MTLDELTAIANLAQRCSDRRSVYYRIMQFHLRQALTTYWMERSPEQWFTIIRASYEPDEASEIANFSRWCLDHLGYMPMLVGDEIVFHAPADATLFHLRWHNVTE